MDSPILKQVKALLAQGDLDEAIKLLSTFSESNLKGNKANKIKNEIVHLQGQIAEVKTAQNRGLIAFEEAERKQNRIRTSMLNLTDVVAGVEGAILEAPKAAVQNSGSNNIYKYIVVGIGAIIVFVIAITMMDSGDEGGDVNPAMDSPAQFEQGDTNSPAVDGCFFTTLEPVNVYAEPDYAGVIVGSLPAELEVAVIEFKVVRDAESGEDIEYMLIAENNLNGWVENDGAVIVDSSCD